MLVTGKAQGGADQPGRGDVLAGGLMVAALSMLPAVPAATESRISPI